MSIRAIAWVLDHSETTGTDRLVLIAVANHANTATGDSRPGNRRIAHEARIARSTVSRAVRRLVARGDLVVVVPGRGKRTASYRLSTNGADLVSDPPRGIANGVSRDPSRADHKKSRSDPHPSFSDPPRRSETVSKETEPRDAREIRAELLAVEPADPETAISTIDAARAAIGRPRS